MYETEDFMVYISHSAIYPQTKQSYGNQITLILFFNTYNEIYFGVPFHFPVKMSDLGVELEVLSWVLTVTY